MQRKLVKSYLMEFVPTKDWLDFMCALGEISHNYTVMSLVDVKVLNAVRVKPCKRW